MKENLIQKIKDFWFGTFLSEEEIRNLQVGERYFFKKGRRLWRAYNGYEIKGTLLEIVQGKNIAVIGEGTYHPSIEEVRYAYPSPENFVRRVINLKKVNSYEKL